MITIGELKAIVQVATVVVDTVSVKLGELRPEVSGNESAEKIIGDIETQVKNLMTAVDGIRPRAPELQKKRGISL